LRLFRIDQSATKALKISIKSIEQTAKLLPRIKYHGKNLRSAQCQCVKTLLRDPVSHNFWWGRLKSGITFAGTWHKIQLPALPYGAMKFYAFHADFLCHESEQLGFCIVSGIWKCSTFSSGPSRMPSSIHVVDLYPRSSVRSMSPSLHFCPASCPASLQHNKELLCPWHFGYSIGLWTV